MGRIGWLMSGLWLGGLLFAAPAAALDGVVFPETAPGELQPAEPASNLSRFSSDQITHLRELRQWLAGRKLAREATGVLTGIQRVIPNPTPDLRLPGAAGRREREVLTPLGQRYALGFENHRRGFDSRPPPVPRQPGPAFSVGWSQPGRYPSQGERQWVQTQGSGVIISGQRVVRIGTPFPDRRESPGFDEGLQDVPR